MNDDQPHRRQQLFADFPELADEGAQLSKEVLAHFGLVFSGYALLEAAMQNLYICKGLSSALARKAIQSQADWQSEQAHLEKKAFASTFGSLLKLIEPLPEIQAQLPELRSLKRARDHFAHHFFREENPFMFEHEQRLSLLAEMNVLRRRVKAAEKDVDEICFSTLRLLYAGNDLEKMMQSVSAELRQQGAGQRHPGFA